MIFSSKGQPASPGQSDGGQTNMKFTAVMVSGATSDAERLLNVGDPFWLTFGPGQTTLVLESYACILGLSRG
jgi:hypothetical protein